MEKGCQIKRLRFLKLIKKETCDKKSRKCKEEVYANKTTRKLILKEMVIADKKETDYPNDTKLFDSHFSNPPFTKRPEKTLSDTVINFPLPLGFPLLNSPS